MATERLMKWEDRRREHLGSLLTILLGLSSASIAFCGSLLTQDAAKFGGCRTVTFLAAVAFFVLSLVASLLAVFSRLQDARTTANIVRADEESMVAGYIQRLRTKADFWGSVTWAMLYTQLITFFVGVCFLFVALALIFRGKLFP